MRKTQCFRRTRTSQGYLSYLNIAVHCNDETIVNRVASQRQTEAIVFVLVVTGAVCVYDS